MSIIKSIDYEALYRHTWLKYKMYSCTNYRLMCGNGVYLIISEKDNYIDGKKKYMIQAYVEQGLKIHQYSNVTIDIKRIKYIEAEDYITNILEGVEQNEFKFKYAK